MEIMLCGAQDTSSIMTVFQKVVRGFGAEPTNYLDASHHYENSMYSSAEQNSRKSVDEADICVFVIKREYGQITWTVELEQALRRGVPFLIFCEKETMDTYFTLKDHGGPSDTDSFKVIFDLLYEVEHRRALTLCRFLEVEFEDELRRQLGRVMDSAVKLLNDHQRRRIALRLLSSDDPLDIEEIKVFTEIATDEYELKKIRKDVIVRLSKQHCFKPETVLDLISSLEQGVSRITLDYLECLMVPEFYTESFLVDCVAAVNESDDVGTKRRLISKILDVDLKKGLKALQDFRLDEIGSKRRLTSELLERKDEIKSIGLQELAMSLAEECHKKASDGGWRADCQGLIEELKNGVIE